MDSILMGDTGAAILAGLAIIAALLSLAVAVRYRGLTVPVGPASFTAMGIGSVGIVVFYICRWLAPGLPLSVMIPISRILWAFVLVSTIIMSGTVLWVEDNRPIPKD